MRPDENEEHSIYAQNKSFTRPVNLYFVSFPVNKKVKKANNEDHCLVHHLRFGMRNRLKKGSQIESLEISYLTAFWWTAK